MPSPSELWERIRLRRTLVPRFVEIPTERALPRLTGVSPILPQHHYFAVVVDELFLAYARKWHREFDPMVLAITEFVHGNKAVSLPFVIGPKLLGENAGMKVPQGMLYRRTRVAGVHPFRGGRVISTIVLCQVRRVDYARRLLKFVESVAATVPFSGELGAYVRYADSLLDGVDALLGMEETTPLVGIRQEFDHDLGSPIHPAYFVLVDGPETEFPASNLWVQEGTLMIGTRENDLKPLRDASYVLFSTRGAAELTDVNTLPLHATVSTITELSASSDGADWKRAKAELVVLLRQLLSSPDFTRGQALRYHAIIVEQAQEAHDNAKSIGTLKAALEPEIENELRRATDLLDLP